MLPFAVVGERLDATVEEDDADLYRWVFGESHTEHFRVIYALSPDALRSTVREVD